MLNDHFHSPLKDRRPWTGFHSMWATKLAVAISRKLPDGWFAAPTVHWDIEVDVATFEQSQAEKEKDKLSAASVTIPEPTKTINFSFATDVIEIQVYREFGELTLVGAVEFVSPANKDRLENREAFIAKCDAYLRDTVGLVVVDVVTSRHANLHNDLMRRFGEPADEESHLYASAYRPFPSASGPALSIWYRPLELGGDLPTMLLFLKDGPVVEVPLSETYRETCQDLKMAAG